MSAPDRCPYGDVCFSEKLEYDGATPTPVPMVHASAFNFSTATDNGFAVPARPATAGSRSGGSHSANASLDLTGADLSGSGDNSIKVILRVRPFNADELAGEKAAAAEAAASSEEKSSAAAAAAASTPPSSLVVASNQHVSFGGDGRNAKSATGQVFTYDTVLGQESTQADVFEAAGRPIADNCVAGYNATIFAYGQTGAGKTHTYVTNPRSTQHTAQHTHILPNLTRWAWHVL